MVCCLCCCLCVVLTGCRTQRTSREMTDYQKQVSNRQEIAARHERRNEVYMDSLMLMKGLMERSSNVSDSASHLETCYATSDAVVRGGRLYHSIANRDSVPGRVKYVFVKREIRDTEREPKRQKR